MASFYPRLLKLLYALNVIEGCIHIFILFGLYGIESKMLATNFDAEWAYSDDWDELVRTQLFLWALRMARALTSQACCWNVTSPKCPRKVST